MRPDRFGARKGIYLLFLRWDYMRYLTVLLVICMLASVVVLPAGAFRADRLEITLLDNGSADIDFKYSLSWIEYAAIFLQIVDPAAELQSVLSHEFKSEVSVRSTSSSSTQLTVEKFVQFKEHEGTIMMTTPGISFARSKQIMARYWFAPLVNPDFSPSLIEMRFPDGYSQTWNDMNAIPSVTHEWRA